MEDSDQNIHLKNLSLHQATTEEEALNLLFLGDTNRMIAEVVNFSLQAVVAYHKTSQNLGDSNDLRRDLA